MSRKYTARIDGKEFVIEHDDGRVLVNGEEVDVEQLRLGSMRILRVGTHRYDVTSLQREDDGTRSVRLNGKRLRVELEDEVAAMLRSFGGEKATKLHAAIVRSPMPGKITRVLVREGELIEAGQGVLILEAMKMENEIKAPAAGIVKAVHVSESDAVEKNTALIELS
ncbi:MAG: acetyl-CoA carboxylase biotin carboxyl carrier protein subunit [Bacteroidota bacterium]|nr:acetyl-CoA carboxylase biotin carboxyl carrier protein subunit [Bacteroidota bacterium]